MTFNGKANWLVVLHGLGEHLEAHDYICPLLEQSYNILQFDLRGHGKSEGERGHIDYFWNFTTDLNEIILWLYKNVSIKELSLFGHSMGALILSDYVQNLSHLMRPPMKVFLSSPPVGLPGLGKILQHSPGPIMGVLSDILLHFTDSENDDHTRYSHDPEVVDRKKSDPLMTEHVSNKLVAEIVHASKRVFERPLCSSGELYVAIGGSDKVVCPPSAIEYFYKVEKAKEVLLIPDAYHELYNETQNYRNSFLEYCFRCLRIRNSKNTIGPNLDL